MICLMIMYLLLHSAFSIYVHTNMFTCSLEYHQEKKRLYTGSPLMVSFDVYPRVLTYLFILVPVLSGFRLLPKDLYLCLPLISFFSLTVNRTVLYNLLTLSEFHIAVSRCQVECQCSWITCIAFLPNLFIHVNQCFYLYMPLFRRM